jgi:N-acetyl-beta-hexosaminidase
VPEGFAIPVMVIDDSPRFVWRGLMIDVTRHFMSLPALKRQIDAMELVKLNVLHVHLSDQTVRIGVLMSVRFESTPTVHSYRRLRQRSG